MSVLTLKTLCLIVGRDTLNVPPPKLKTKVFRLMTDCCVDTV